MKKNSFYQNTGFGWWSTGDVAETLRVPGGVIPRKQIW